MMFFLLKGTASYVLPQYNNTKYINIEIGDQFGLIDVIASAHFQNFDPEDWFQRKDALERQFTIKATDYVEVLNFLFQDFARMRKEFLEYYEALLLDHS